MTMTAKMARMTTGERRTLWPSLWLGGWSGDGPFQPRRRPPPPYIQLAGDSNDEDGVGGEDGDASSLSPSSDEGKGRAGEGVRLGSRANRRAAVVVACFPGRGRISRGDGGGMW